MLSVSAIGVVILGVVLGVAFVVVARRSADELSMYAAGLFVAAAIYVGFAPFAAPGVILRELVGLALFGAVAWLGWKRWPLLLAAGWAAHVAWDVALHPPGADDGVYWWYPPLCIGFDLVVAARIAFRRSAAATPPGPAAPA